MRTVLEVRGGKLYQLKKIAVDEVFAAMDAGEKSLMVDGVPYKLSSQRLKLFHRDGVVCVRCGKSGVYFMLETSSMKEKAHLNLYGIDEKNEPLLFTKDHILPRSRGGFDRMDNYQVMCAVCNMKKSSSTEEEWLARMKNVGTFKQR